MGNMLEHLWAAVFLLVSAESIKRRLVDAYSAHLAEIDQNELPHEVRDEFKEIVHTISHVKPLRGESAVQATVRKMSDADASRCATSIVEFLGKITELQSRPRQKVLRAVNSDLD